MQKDRRVIRAVWGLACICAAGMLAGCVGPSEMCRGFAGISTEILKQGRGDAVTHTYAADAAAADVIVRGVVQKSGAYIYAEEQNPRLIACYVSETDTTPVGIFIVPQSAGSVEVMVASPSRYAKERMAAQVDRGFSPPAPVPPPVVPSNAAVEVSIVNVTR